MTDLDIAAREAVEHNFKRSGFNRFAEPLRPAVQVLAGLLALDMRRDVAAVIEAAISDLARKRLKIGLGLRGSSPRASRVLTTKSGESVARFPTMKGAGEAAPVKHFKLHGVKRLQIKNNSLA